MLHCGLLPWDSTSVKISPLLAVINKSSKKKGILNTSYKILVQRPIQQGNFLHEVVNLKKGLIGLSKDHLICIFLGISNNKECLKFSTEVQIHPWKKKHEMPILDDNLTKTSKAV